MGSRKKKQRRNEKESSKLEVSNIMQEINAEIQGLSEDIERVACATEINTYKAINHIDGEIKGIEYEYKAKIRTDSMALVDDLIVHLIEANVSDEEIESIIELHKQVQEELHGRVLGPQDRNLIEKKINDHELARSLFRG